MQLEGKDQADAELLALVMHKDASAESCLAALSAALKAPNCGALKSAADIVLERFAEDATVPLRFVEALLDTSKEKVRHILRDSLYRIYQGDMTLHDLNPQGISMEAHSCKVPEDREPCSS